MSKEFIQNGVGSSSIAEAVRQQKTLAYWTEGKIQQPVNDEYIKAFINRNYITDDYFLNWVKTIFGDVNFLAFFKYLRNPVPSAKIVNNKIKPQLERVFHAEDSYFKYVIKGDEVEEPENLQCEEFNEWMLNALMYRHNDILVHDLEDVNTPCRNLISIENVVAIESHKNRIKRLSYRAEMTIDDVVVRGYLYLDDKVYSFFDDSYNIRNEVFHDLGECPADYISPEAFSDDDIVRKSMFSYVGTDLEEYSFLKTLQRMSDVNGTIPVTAILDYSDRGDDDDVDADPEGPNMPMSVSSQQAKHQREVQGKQTEVQAGSIIPIRPKLKDDGSIDTAQVQYYIKHFYMPVEAMRFVNERVIELQNEIIQSVTGDFKEQNESAQNEKQVSKGYQGKQDSLRNLSKSLSRIRTISDAKMLKLQHGASSVYVKVFFGSDHFQESQSELYEMLDKAGNPIERRSILRRINRNKYRFNAKESKRKDILYSLMPYSTDKDLETAISTSTATPENLLYQNQFNYWITRFESSFGDIVTLWDSMESDDSKKLIYIDTLIKQLIKAELPKQIQTNE